MRKISPGLAATVLLLVLLVEINCEERTSSPESSTKCTRVPAREVHRFDNKTQRCYNVGKKGPCGDLMIFYADPSDPDAGECDCDISLRCHRPLIYWPPQDRCYLAFDQGPCGPSDWLTFTTRSSPICRTNPCLTNQTEEFNDLLDGKLKGDNYWIEAKGECVQTNTQGFCHYPNEVVAINGFTRKVKPHCTVVQMKCTTPNVPSLFCAPGQKWAIGGMCDIRCKKTKTTKPHFRRNHRRHRHHHWTPRRHVHSHRYPFKNHHHTHTHNHDWRHNTGVETTTTSDLGNDFEDDDENDSSEDIGEGYSPAEVPSQFADEFDDDDLEDETPETIDHLPVTTTTTEEPKLEVWRSRRVYNRRRSWDERRNYIGQQ